MHSKSDSFQKEDVYLFFPFPLGNSANDKILGQTFDFFLIIHKTYCDISLELPQRGNSKRSQNMPNGNTKTIAQFFTPKNSDFSGAFCSMFFHLRVDQMSTFIETTEHSHSMNGLAKNGFNLKKSLKF